MYGMIEVHAHRQLPDYEPFILAQQATQCCYLSYPGATGQRANWLAVCTIRPRGWLEPVKDNSDLDAYQLDDDDDEQFELEPPDVGGSVVGSAIAQEYLSDKDECTTESGEEHIM